MNNIKFVIREGICETSRNYLKELFSEASYYFSISRLSTAGPFQYSEVLELFLTES